MRGVKAASAIAQEYCDRARVATVRTRVRNNNVRIVIMIQVGHCDPARAGTGREGDLTELLSMR